MLSDPGRCNVYLRRYNPLGCINLLTTDLTRELWPTNAGGQHRIIRKDTVLTQLRSNKCYKKLLKNENNGGNPK